ncbi:hypothetical protein [Pseudomonas taetrolens]|uniref:hypothetical protein n=1 Tax=Pseudomonas taetrolens TaxID=47884 RepID=UPI0030D958F4
MPQMVVMSDVTIQAGGNAHKILVKNADGPAGLMPFLLHAISPDELSVVPGEGVQGRCRLTGKMLLSIGVDKAYMSLISRKGRVGLGSSGGSGSLGLKLPDQSASSSYTIVCAINIGLGTHDTYTVTRQLINGYSDSGILSNQMLSATGAGNPSPTFKNKLLTVGAGINSPFAITEMPDAEQWALVAVDYNDLNGVVSISRDGINWETAQRAVGGNSIGGTGYVTIGLPTANTGLTDNLVGDVFVFSDSLRAHAADDLIAGLMAAMAIDYGIVG